MKEEFRELEYGEYIKSGDEIQGVGRRFILPANSGMVGTKYMATTPWKVYRKVLTSEEVAKRTEKIFKKARKL